MTAIERAAFYWRRVEVWSNIPARPGGVTTPFVRGETRDSIFAARQTRRIERSRMMVRLGRNPDGAR